MPLYGGKCFDITLASPDAAARLAQEGIDYEQSHKPLRLLGRSSIHVSIFVSVELLNLLTTYGELNSRTVQTFTHIENDVCVIEFNKIDCDIPKRVFAGSLEMGFEYSGQPVTCHHCHSTEHVVSDCPKRRKPTDRGGVVPDPPHPNTLQPKREKKIWIGPPLLYYSQIPSPCTPRQPTTRLQFHQHSQDPSQ